MIAWRNGEILPKFLKRLSLFRREEFLAKLGRPFCRSREVFPVEGSGDTLTIARDLYNKWIRLSQLWEEAAYVITVDTILLHSDKQSLPMSLTSLCIGKNRCVIWLEIYSFAVFTGTFHLPECCSAVPVIRNLFSQIWGDNNKDTHLCFIFRRCLAQFFRRETPVIFFLTYQNDCICM